jgi:hypothetical protein
MLAISWLLFETEMGIILLQVESKFILMSDAFRVMPCYYILITSFTFTMFFPINALAGNLV